MSEGTQEDWAAIASQFLPFAAKGGARVLDHLRLLDGDYGGFPVDRLEHSLQTATRAHRDGRDDEYVACALLHDIGDTLGAFNHPDIAAVVISPIWKKQLDIHNEIKKMIRTILRGLGGWDMTVARQHAAEIFQIMLNN